MQFSQVNLTYPAKRKKKTLRLTPWKRFKIRLDTSVHFFCESPSNTCFHCQSNSHSLVLPSHLFCLSLACCKTLSDSKDLLWGARGGPGYASDHHCMRGIWWHKAWVMWYCHQSALTRLALSRQNPARLALTASRAAVGQGTGTHTHTDTHTLKI